jgi:hypothetical protein
VKLIRLSSTIDPSGYVILSIEACSSTGCEQPSRPVMGAISSTRGGNSRCVGLEDGSTTRSEGVSIFIIVIASNPRHEINVPEVFHLLETVTTESTADADEDPEEDEEEDYAYEDDSAN